jgi:hypothetical protein
MSERKRRQGDPARFGPVRHFANIYRRPGSSNGEANSESPMSQQPRRPKESRSDQVSAGVGLAYRVIEKYINEGRRVGEQFNRQPDRRGATTRPLQELVNRMLRYQAELLPLWLDLLGSLTKVDFARIADPAGSDRRQLRKRASTDGKVSIELTSTRPTEISFELQEDSESFALVIPGLQALDPHKPTLTDIHFVPRTGRGRGKLRVTIPNRQPPGTYSGVIVDRKTGDIRGTLSVRVADIRSSAGKRAK